MSYLATRESNWATNESIKEHHKKAIQASKERKRYEKKLKAEGKKQVLIPHPTSPKCFIVKFI